MLVELRSTFILGEYSVKLLILLRTLNCALTSNESFRVVAQNYPSQKAQRKKGKTSKNS